MWGREENSVLAARTSQVWSMWFWRSQQTEKDWIEGRKENQESVSQLLREKNTLRTRGSFLSRWGP